MGSFLILLQIQLLFSLVPRTRPLRSPNGSGLLGSRLMLLHLMSWEEHFPSRRSLKGRDALQNIGLSSVMKFPTLVTSRSGCLALSAAWNIVFVFHSRVGYWLLLFFFNFSMRTKIKRPFSGKCKNVKIFFEVEKIWTHYGDILLQAGVSVLALYRVNLILNH